MGQKDKTPKTFVKSAMEKGLEAEWCGLTSQASNQLMEHVRIRVNLPRVLAEAIYAGHSEKVLVAIIDWGKGQRPIIDIWKELTSLVGNIDEPRGVE